MKYFAKAAAAASILTASAIPFAASAQVQGIATADTVNVVAQTKSFQNAYNQIQTQYKSFADQIQAKSVELNAMNAKLDTNGDKEVNQQEMDNAVRAKNPVLAQIRAKTKEINDLAAPIEKARVYAIDQIVKQYGTAQSNVIRSKKISLMLAPDAFLYAPDSVDVSSAITAELDRILPAVNIAPPADWRASRQSIGLYQQIQQVITLSRRAQAAQAAQAQPAAAQPGGR